MSALATVPKPDPGLLLPPLQVPPVERTRSRWPIYALLIALLCGIAVWYFQSGRTKPPANAGVRTVRAVRGTLTPARRIAGSITAERFSTITAPILQAPDTGRALTLTYLADSGSHVKEGDLL